MNTLYVWVLIFYTGAGHGMIDNIASNEECLRVRESIRELHPSFTAKCIQVKKARQ